MRLEASAVPAEELPCPHAGVVKARHRAAIQPEPPGGDHEVGRLKAPVAEGGALAEGAVVLAGEEAARIKMRREERELPVELFVVGEDGGHGRGLHLRPVGLHQVRHEPGLGALRDEEARAQRR